MRYIVYSTVETQGWDDQGAPVDTPARTVLNAVEWDGKSAYDPGINLKLVQSDTLQIGDPVPN